MWFAERWQWQAKCAASPLFQISVVAVRLWSGSRTLPGDCSLTLPRRIQASQLLPYDAGRETKSRVSPEKCLWLSAQYDGKHPDHAMAQEPALSAPADQAFPENEQLSFFSSFSPIDIL